MSTPIGPTVIIKIGPTSLIPRLGSGARVKFGSWEGNRLQAAHPSRGHRPDHLAPRARARVRSSSPSCTRSSRRRWAGRTTTSTPSRSATSVYGMQFDDSRIGDRRDRRGDRFVALRRRRATASSMNTTSATRGSHEVVVESIESVPLRAQVRRLPRRPAGLSTRGLRWDLAAIAHLLEALADPTHEEHDDYLELGRASTSIPRPSTWPPPTPPSSGCADQAWLALPRLALVERRRKLSVPVSMMWALKVSRSTMAATSRGSPITWPHSENGQIRGRGHRRLLLALGQDLEQQLSPSGVELDVAELVEAQQVEPAIAGHQPGQSPFVGRLGQFVDQCGAGDVAHRLALLAGGHAEADEQVALAGSAVAEQARPVAASR